MLSNTMQATPASKGNHSAAVRSVNRMSKARFILGLQRGDSLNFNARVFGQA